MSIGQILLDRHLLTPDQLEQARRHQKLAGCSLSESFVILGFVDTEQLEAIYHEPPPVPDSVAETGLDLQFLLGFVLRCIYVTGLETIPDVAEFVKLPAGVLDEVFESARKKRLLAAAGVLQSDSRIMRYVMTDAGRQRALEAMEQCQYAGPAPVPLADYWAQLEKQSISHERVTADDLARSFEHLVLPAALLRRLGPGVRSGKSLLLYGGVGNGKTSIAEAIGNAFRHTIYVPHCIYVDGQIIKIFDPAVHQRASVTGGASPQPAGPRWVRCQRPVVITGGELTMEMLDLTLDPISKYYEAPSHIKANGGVFVIDDFGRQRVRSVDLLNRWILPLERQQDYLTLHTGQKLRLPFDQLVVFSTNLAPEQMMDAAALRRIPYKLRIDPPSPHDYAEIFRRVCDAHHMELPGEVLQRVIDEFYPRTPGSMEPAGYQPKRIVEHVLACCSFEGSEPELTMDRVTDALKNLTIHEATPAV